MVFLFKQRRTFVVVRVPVWAQLPPCCYRLCRNKALIIVVGRHKQLNTFVKGKTLLLLLRTKAPAVCCPNFTHLPTQPVFVFAKHNITHYRCVFLVWTMMMFRILPFLILKLCQHIDSLRGRWWGRQERVGWDEKKTLVDSSWCAVEAIKRLASGNLRQSKASVGNQGTLFRNCWTHTQTEGQGKTRQHLVWVHPPCVLVPDQQQSTLHACM